MESDLLIVGVGGAYMAVVPLYSRLVDPSYLPHNLSVGDMLFRIRAMNPGDYDALEKIITDVFRRNWDAQHQKDTP
jgi:hypothetical protein